MRVARPRTVEGTLDALARLPDPQLVAGGTDFVVEVNFGHRRPSSVVALRRVDALRGYALSGTEARLGAGLTFTEVQTQLAEEFPALAAAARTVGSPQMRNAGTIGGNVVTASPAGDSLPVLLAADADVELTGQSGTRTVALADFVTGVKRTDIRRGEVLTAVQVPRLRGPQQFLKVGTRNAMVISIVCLALILDVDSRTVRCGLGAVGPVVLRATEAEAFISAELDWDSLTAPPGAVQRFGELAAAAARPITDHRATADYRRHAVAVTAARALERSLRA